MNLEREIKNAFLLLVRFFHSFVNVFAVCMCSLCRTVSNLLVYAARLPLLIYFDILMYAYTCMCSTSRGKGRK